MNHSLRLSVIICLLLLALNLAYGVRGDDRDEKNGSAVRPGGGVYRVGGGVTAPRVIFAPDPQYTDRARKAKEVGQVVLWLIVTPEGTARDVKVAKGLSRDLDQKAVEAVSKWKFKPATKDGVPVAVQINVMVQFKLF